MQARRVVFAAPRTVEIEPIPVDEPADGEVVVRAELSGISGGTEMLAYRGELDRSLPIDEAIGALNGTFTYPFAYGYSVSGRVERSRAALTEGTRVFAFHPHQDVFVVAASDVVPIGEMPARDATLFPLVETALQIRLDTGLRAEETAVVAGLGPVGILAAAIFAREGVAVIGSDPLAWRRDAAAKFDVRAVPPEDLAGAVDEATGGQGVATAVEASGNPNALANLLPLLAHEGTALVASWYGTKPVALPLGAEFHRRRLHIRSTQVSTIPSALAGQWTRERRRAVALELMTELPLSVLATHEFEFERAAEAYAALDRREDGLIHAALRYS